MSTAKVICPRCKGAGDGDGDMRPVCWECTGSGEVPPAEAEAIREHYRRLAAQEPGR